MRAISSADSKSYFFLEKNKQANNSLWEFIQALQID